MSLSLGRCSSALMSTEACSKRALSSSVMIGSLGLLGDAIDPDSRGAGIASSVVDRAVKVTGTLRGAARQGNAGNQFEFRLVGNRDALHHRVRIAQFDRHR